MTDNFNPTKNPRESKMLNTLPNQAICHPNDCLPEEQQSDTRMDNVHTFQRLF